jgi:hypothetical protein
MLTRLDEILNATPDNANNQTALETAAGPDTRRDLLVTWLRERGATPGGSTARDRAA